MNMLKKGELYYPSSTTRKKAWVKNKNIYQEANKDPVLFWEKLARELFWFEKWNKAFEHKAPYFKWFLGGKINITSNIFEKNPQGWEKIKKKTALIWEPEPTTEKPKKITYRELFSDVCRFANALKKLGVKKGDRVGIYLPMIPEVMVAMLACARIGVVHSVVFSAFSSNSLKVRLQDTEAKVLITADGYWRRGKIVDLKQSADEGVKETKVEKVIVVKRAGNNVSLDSQKDLWFHEIVKNEKDFCEAEPMDAEDTFFILYTSGSTGKPKGVVHTCGGYAVQAYWTGKWIFDFQGGDIFWCTSDPGWVTGHTYTVYSPLLNGITTLMFEGAPDWPKPDRWAQTIEKHKVNIFYTAPTAIRMFEKYGAALLKKYKFKNLRLLGSVGEPIDESSWLWYFTEVGKKRCPIVDTWWQTETGGILITSLPGLGPFKPAFAGLAFPGVQADIKNGNLVILPPFTPGMLRGIYKNPQKYEETYWSSYGKDVYFTSDGATRDKNGLIRIVGRVDDVLKVAGHRLTTGEMEDAINLHPNITESAVIGVSDEIKGEVPVAFIVPKENSQNLAQEVLAQIKKEIGPIALPKQVFVVDDLPKTRSGKIMRRILKKIISREDLGDLSTLANPESVEKIKLVVQKNQAGFIIALLNIIFITAGIAAIIIGLLWSTGVLEQIPGIFKH
ncbi:MAG: acetyl-CoA synthetase [Parcubacteria group bacterium Gr01-1014_30]|nr:MAG: acetyl-CoA synthetase [Parcubacteria group bacterium Gr01-1014_30]